MNRRGLLALAGALVMGAVAGSANAGALAVSPLLLEMSPERMTRSMEVSNPSDKPMNVQLRLFAWSGGGFDEKYAPSQDVAFSPPMFRLAPGQRQVVRFMSRVTPDREMSYRIFVDQIDPQPEGGGISMPVRMAIPLFLMPGTASKPAVEWRLGADAQGPVLVARNTGARRLRVTNLELASDAGVQSVAPGLSGYVLAGQERAWRVKPQSDPSRLVVRAITDQGDLKTGLARD